MEPYQPPLDQLEGIDHRVGVEVAAPGGKGIPGAVQHFMEDLVLPVVGDRAPGQDNIFRESWSRMPATSQVREASSARAPEGAASGDAPALSPAGVLPSEARCASSSCYEFDCHW
jgi:hypothetical protein